MSTRTLAVVVPALNEEAAIERLVRVLARDGAAVYVVDGGSVDETRHRAMSAGARLVVAGRGRARQMNAGARRALDEGARRLLFVHADATMPVDWLAQLDGARRPWGRFDVRIDATGWRGLQLRIVGQAMNLRSRLTGICTGDQCLLVDAGLFEKVGGFPDQRLMEDIEISRRLRRVAGPPACLRGPVGVSPRRWLRDGVLVTIVRMWWWRARYFLGASPERLAREYYGADVGADDARPRPGGEDG